jgi:hypothetical protein
MDHPSSFLCLDLFAVLSDHSIPRDGKGRGAVPGDKKPTSALVLEPLSIPAVLGVGWRCL